MADPAIPEPLRTVLVNVFHANVFSSDWREQLANFERTVPYNDGRIRRQFADAIFRNTVSWESFAKLTGIQVFSEDEMKEWFRDRFREHWGGEAREWHASPQPG